MSGAPRHGIALLVVLGCLVLITALIRLGLGAMRSWHGQDGRTRTEEHLLQGLADGQRLACQWLGAEAEQVVLPFSRRGLLVVDDRWEAERRTGGLQVVLFDGLAGVPVRHAASGGMLRSALPPGIGLPAMTMGDPWSSADALERCRLPAGVGRYPSPHRAASPPDRWSGGSVTGGLPDAEDRSAPQGATSLVEAVSFISDGRINLNTASREVLRLVLQAAGRDDSDAPLRAREAGRPVALGLPTGLVLPSLPGITLVERSDCWQALITVWSDGVVRSWWVAILGDRSGFTVAGRHAIP